MAVGRRLSWLRGRRPAFAIASSHPGVSRAIVAVLLVVSFLACAPAMAQIGSDRYSSIVVDAATGRVLSAVNPDDQRHPASLTKRTRAYSTHEADQETRSQIGVQRISRGEVLGP